MYGSRLGVDSQLRQVHIRGVALIIGFLVLAVATSFWLVSWSVGTAGFRVTSWSVEDSPLDLSAKAPSGEVPKPRTGLVATKDNRGQVLFGRYCDSCHPAAKQGIGPALVGTSSAAARKPEAIVQIVRNGGFSMPAFKQDLIADADLQEVTKYLVILSGGTWTGPVPMPAPQAAPQPAAAQSAGASGEAVFAKSCEACHPGAKQGMGPSLRTAQFKSAYPTEPQLAQMLRDGKGGMPPFKADRLSDADLNALVKYILALPIDK